MRVVSRFNFILIVLLFRFPLSAQVADGAHMDRNEQIQAMVEHELDSLFHYSSLAYLQPDAFRLTDYDIQRFSERYQIEPAAVKAVLDIEAGKYHNGFSEPCLPLINFDQKLFRQRLAKTGVNMSAIRQQYPELFVAPAISKYGTQQRKEHALLEQAREINDRLAVECTFWGMFQIGGFCWQKCGAPDVDVFVKEMSRSERDQLAMFGILLENTGMLELVRKKQWERFARAYNGPSYKARGYDRRLIKAYNKYKKNMQ